MQLAILHKTNLKRLPYFLFKQKVYSLGLACLVFLFSIQLHAAQNEPCREFSSADFQESPKLVAKIRGFIQTDFEYQLPENDEALRVKLCQKGIRKYSDQQIVIMTFLACAHFELGTFDKTVTLLEEVLLFADESKHLRSIILAHNHLGMIASTNDYRLSAYFHYQKLIELGEKYNNTYSQFNAYLNLGAFNFKNRMYDDAEKHYLKCLELLEKEPNNTTRNWVIHRLGELKREQGDHEASVAYLEEAINFWEENDEYKGACYSYLQMGFVYEDKNPKLTEHYFLKALKAGEKSAYKLCKVEIELNLGYFYLRHQRLDEALVMFENVLKYDEQKESIPRIMKAHQMMVRIYSEKKQPIKANESQKAYLLTSEKYNENIKRNDSKSIKNVERLILQKKEYELLQQAELHTQETLFFQRILIFFACLGLVLAVGLALTYFRKNKKNKAQKEALSILNQQNKKQAEELAKAQAITKRQKKDLEVEMVKKAIVLSQQGEILQSIAKQLDTMETNIGTRAIRREVTKVKDNNLWTELNLQISQSNEVFFKKLLKKHPKLTQSDLRLCAFLKMNMNTKEIANLTFKNPESIKVARSRLRKKLGLTHSNITFTTFLNQIN